MKVFFLLALLVSFSSVKSHAKEKKNRYYKRPLSISLVNAYTFYSSIKKTNVFGPKDAERLIDGDGQMYPFFSALELARNFRRVELGIRIQNTLTTFISPFFKLNIVPNSSKPLIVPSLTIGFIPSYLMGGWMRASLALSLGHYSSLEPFIGAYAWYKIKDLAKYEKKGLHVHAGVKLNFYL
ncbi:MAG: hypothetical protein GDA46_06275 [Bdellovibrionales bacterium]|nr:hypothetical protein [Bdellovibrionales bacterium]